jgi:hypothetical protein
MKNLLSFILILAACSPNTKEKSVVSQTFEEQTVNFITETKSNETIELPNLYDSLTTQIVEDSLERLKLAEILKRKGFKEINWGRGNYPPLGFRIISLTLKKDSCFCLVNKIYYATITKDVFQMSEQIRCADSLSFYE